MTFDDVIPAVLRVSEETPGFMALERACLVRDLQGRARLVVKPGEDRSLDTKDLSARLESALGKYFSAPVVSSASDAAEEARLARLVFDRASTWPAGWATEYVDPVSGETRALSADLWCALPRYLSKEIWLSTAAGAPPWPLIAANPPLVAFYSFKGGVGRSTLLACMARDLARQQKRVAVIDLDLEAPGVAHILGAKAPRGVIDFVLDHAVNGKGEIDGLHGPAKALGPEESDRVSVFPAGRMDWSYLEKLARLDYVATGPANDPAKSPVAEALLSLLKLVKSELAPDAILIDSRSGLHDLGGLSLHALSHVDVLVTRASPQGLDGLRLSLEALVRRKTRERLECVVVHSFAPLPRDDAEGRGHRDRFRREIYDTFREIVYADSDESIPDEGDDSKPHWPCVFPRFEVLERARTMADVPDAIVGDDEVSGIFRRIEEVCRPDEEEPGEDPRDAG